MKKGILLGLLGLLCFVMIVGCGGGGSKNHDLQVHTILWEPDGNGYIQLYTNDETYANYIFTDTFRNSGYTDFKIQAKKVSGLAGAGFGFVYNYYNISNFDCVLINTYGRYSWMSRTNGGPLTKIIDWTSFSHLSSGNNALNTIKISKNNNGGSDLYFNDYKALSIATPSSSLNFGFIVLTGPVSGSGPLEDFPNVPEDVRFNQTINVSYSVSNNNVAETKTLDNNNIIEKEALLNIGSIMDR